MYNSSWIPSQRGRPIQRDDIDIRYLKIAGTAHGAGEISNQDQLGVTPNYLTQLHTQQESNGF